MRPSTAARKSGLWLPQARSARISRRSAGSPYAPTASRLPLDGTITAVDQRPSLANGGAGEALTHRKLEAEQRPVEAVHRDAAEQPAFSVEEVAVRGVGVEELRELVGQPLQDDGQVELAAEHVRRPEQ